MTMLFRLAVLGAVLGCNLRTSADVADAFRNPPREASLQTWWHWVGNGVTKEGITADLEAMRDVGISRAYIFVPSGPTPVRSVEMLSPEWFDLFDHALREAKRCGVELGAHNCPGWSSSGGPWIRPEDSMKMLVASETILKNDETGADLPMPLSQRGFYRDVAVLAFPVPDEPPPISGGGPRTLDAPKVGDTCEFTVSYAAPRPARSLLLTFADVDLSYKGTVEASADGKDWKTVGRISLVLFHTQPTPKSIALSDVPPETRHFRVRLECCDSYPWIAKGPKKLQSVEFTTLSRVPRIEMHNSSGFTYQFAPELPQDRGQSLSSSAIVDLTDRLAKSGRLDWTPPAAQPVWKVLRIGYTTTGAMNRPATLKGLECDKLSRRGLAAHWPHMPAKLLARPFAREVFKSFVIDSYEVGGQNWTDEFAAEFKRRRGYDVIRHLPSVFGYVIDGGEETRRFLGDFQRTVSDLFVDCYFRSFAERCAENGVSCSIEGYGGPFDELEVMSVADVPMGEFWVNEDPGWAGRIAASGGHLHGHRYVAAESFSTWQKDGRWQVTPRSLRANGDFAWAEGVNQFVLHTYAHQPTNAAPGMSMNRHGTHFNRNLTWWSDAQSWTDYVRRGQTLLQAGAPRPDILILTGAGSPNALSRERKLSDCGYEYDWASVSDLLAVSPHRYRLIHLGHDRTLPLTVLEKVERLLAAGAKVAGVKPSGSPVLTDDPIRWRQMVDRLWQDDRVIPEDDVLAAAQCAGLSPAVSLDGHAVSVLVREVGDERIFFLRNPADEPWSGEAALAAEGRDFGARFHAETGAIEPLTVQATGTVARVFLSLPAKGSAFVVLGKRPYAAFGEQPPKGKMERIQDLSSGWKLGRFQGPAAPKGERNLTRLSSWAEDPDESLRFFSGRATYEKTFDWSGAGRVFLDLGEVREIARVRLNGTDLGVWSFPPFCHDVTSALVSGENRLEVEVVNNWPNRLIGDAILRQKGIPEKDLNTWSSYPEAWAADEPLHPAGLLGPVCLRAKERVK